MQKHPPPISSPTPIPPTSAPGFTGHNNILRKFSFTPHFSFLNSEKRKKTKPHAELPQPLLVQTNPTTIAKSTTSPTALSARTSSPDSTPRKFVFPENPPPHSPISPTSPTPPTSAANTPPPPVLPSPQSNLSLSSYSIKRGQHLPSLSVRHHSSTGQMSLDQQNQTQSIPSSSNNLYRQASLNATSLHDALLIRKSSFKDEKQQFFEQQLSERRDSSFTTSSKSSFEPVKETTKIVRDKDPLTGKKMVNQYIIVKQLGRGVHGKVKLVRHSETGEFWALKIVEKNPKRLFPSRLSESTRPKAHLDKIKREIAILKKCEHPHIVRLKEVIDDPSEEKIYLVLEYLSGGDIKWHDNAEPVRNPVLSLQEAREIFRDVICGLEYLHFQGIVHRDIKPANLLWTSTHRVKISDFGVSVFIPPPAASVTIPETGTQSQQTILDKKSTASLDDYKVLSNNELELAKTAGTPAFFAPEVCGVGEDIKFGEAGKRSTLKDLKKKSMAIGTAIDIWALGVTLYCLVFGNVPFTADTELVFPEIKPHEDEEDALLVRDLLTQILEKDPVKRYKLFEIKLHPWTTADLDEIETETWLCESDPVGDPVTVTEDEMMAAVNIMGFIKDRMRKLSTSIQTMATNLHALRRRTKSLPSVSNELTSPPRTSATPTPTRTPNKRNTLAAPITQQYQQFQTQQPKQIPNHRSESALGKQYERKSSSFSNIYNTNSNSSNLGSSHSGRENSLSKKLLKKRNSNKSNESNKSASGYFGRSLTTSSNGSSFGGGGGGESYSAGKKMVYSIESNGQVLYSRIDEFPTVDSTGSNIERGSSGITENPPPQHHHQLHHHHQQQLHIPRPQQAIPPRQANSPFEEFLSSDFDDSDSEIEVGEKWFRWDENLKVDFVEEERKRLENWKLENGG
ncbi:hypothetical protein HK098_004659 [Nowakowskiella sp. JEL0407]|nr:hypothetical protein HK098_004659 [Nowakowskiella sp. JEL0407]